MRRIGGNTEALVQVRTAAKNEIGEAVASWPTVQRLRGFLDLQAGDSKYNSYGTKLQESTHVFVCDWVQLDKRIRAETCRLEIDGEHYDVTVVDDPMGLHRHLEIYLRYTGVQ